MVLGSTLEEHKRDAWETGECCASAVRGLLDSMVQKLESIARALQELSWWCKHPELLRNSTNGVEVSGVVRLAGGALASVTGDLQSDFTHLSSTSEIFIIHR